MFSATTNNSKLKFRRKLYIKMIVDHLPVSTSTCPAMTAGDRWPITNPSSDARLLVVILCKNPVEPLRNKYWEQEMNTKTERQIRLIAPPTRGSIRTDWLKQTFSIGTGKRTERKPMRCVVYAVGRTTGQCWTCDAWSHGHRLFAAALYEAIGENQRDLLNDSHHQSLIFFFILFTWRA